MSQTSKPEVLNTQTLGEAICKHFGLNKDRVASDYEITHAAGLMSLDLTVFLTADDLAGIARKAGANSLGYDRLGRVAFVDAGKDGLVVTPLRSEPGPELINLSAPSKLCDSTLHAEIKAVRDQLASLGKDMSAAAERMARLQAEQAQLKSEPAKPRDAAREPQVDQVLAQIKALHYVFDALSKKQASTGHYPGNALRGSMVFGDKT